MSALERSLEVPLRVIMADDVKASVKRARKGLEAAAKEIVWQIEMEGWRTLGYKSWPEMREAEYGGAACMVPREKRPEIVAQMKSLVVGKTARGKDKHLTDQEIADTLGVSREAVKLDRHPRDDLGKNTQNVDPEPEVIDAEVIEEPTFTCWACQEQYATSQATDTEDGPICNKCIDIYERISAESVTTRTTAPAPVEAAITCPVCGGTGKVTP